MKNHISKTIILLAAIISVLLVSCIGRNSKQYYKSHSGKVITVWGDYVIFEKYKGKLPPKNNYIQMHYKQYQPDFDVVFKRNDSVIIYSSRLDELDINFDQNEYLVEVFGNGYFQEYKKRSAFSDTLVTLHFHNYPMYDLFDKIWIEIFECDGDSVYKRFYRNNTHNYKDYVFSRYE